MQKLLVAFLLLLFLTHSNLATAQSAPLPAQEGPVSQVEGSRRLTPLILKGAPAPETNGQFQEFGETYVMENMLVFWARFGPADKDWGLFSMKGGKVAKILLEDVEFVAPDSRKIKVSRAGVLPARLSAGKRILYISNRAPDHVYGWDGERLVRVLCAGDQLEVGGVRCTVKRAAVLDVGPDGRALIYYDANKPQHTNGWVLHDGTTFTPLFKEGDPLPGMPGVLIKNLSTGPFCLSYCVAAPRLLDDGSILASLEVTGAPYKKALFHIARDKTETIIVERTPRRGSATLETQEPGGPYIGRLGDLLAVRSDSFVMDASGGEGEEPGQVGSLTVKFEKGQVSSITVNSEKVMLLFYHLGKFRLVSPPIETLKPGGVSAGFAFDGAMFLTPGSPRVLVTVKQQGRSEKGLWIAKATDTSFPGLCFWDGEQISDIPWHMALGMDIPAVLKALETKSGPIFRPVPAKGIRLRRISGPLSGVGVVLPTAGSTGARWFVASNSVDGKLERPQFQVAGRTVTAADIVTWKSPEEAVVELEDGFFLLTKAADIK